MSDDLTPSPPPPPEPTQPVPAASSTQVKQPRSWKTWQLVTASVIALVIGVAAGSAGSSTDDDKNNASEETRESSDLSSETTTDDVDDATTTEQATKTEPATTTTRPAPTTTLPKPKTFKVGDKIDYENGASIQVFVYEQPVAGAVFDPEPGNEYAVIDVEVCAGSEEVSYNTFGFVLIAADNRRYDASFGAREPTLGSGDLPAGSGCVRGWVSFEVPQGQRPTTLLWDYFGWEQSRWAIG